MNEPDDAGAARQGRLSRAFRAELRLLRARDEEAWRAIYDEFTPPMRGYLRVRGVRDVDDVIGETWFELARRFDEFTGDRAALRTWVFVIATRRGIDQGRRASSRREMLATTGGEPEPDARPDHADEVVGLLGVAAPMLAVLDGEERIIVWLRVVVGMTAEEVGVTLARPAGTVRVKQHRAIAKLRKAVTPDRADPVDMA